MNAGGDCLSVTEMLLLQSGGFDRMGGWHKLEVKSWLCSRYEICGISVCDYNEARISCQKASASNVVKCISHRAKE